MKQVLVITTTEKAFLDDMDEKIKEGYKVIAGSTFIASLPWDIVVPEGELLSDTEHILTVSITGKYDFMIYAKDIEIFKQEVNSKLSKGDYSLVVGSLSANLVKLDGFKVKIARAYITYYSCSMYKE